MYSEDIVVKILDESGEFIGVMNSATPCDVTQQALESRSDIIPVPLDNITPVGKYKISFLQDLMLDPTIQNALKRSNQKIVSMTDEDITKLREVPWPKPGTENPTELQVSIMQNNVADILRANLKVQSKFGTIQFPEMILTNAKGVNIASTDRTYNYIQSQDEWWQIAVEQKFLIRECGWDDSIQMTSEDIIIAIYENDNLVGVLNAATPCDVILNKSPTFYGDSN